MKNRLYVANLNPAVTEEQLRELFGQHGEVAAVELGVETRFNARYALVTMTVEKTATKALNALNGHKLEGQYLSISYPDADLTRDLLPKQRKALEAIIAELGETDEIPRRQIESIVLFCGSSFAEALLRETLEVEASGGMMTSDGKRRRTKGGVFFYLARPRLSPPIYHIVFTRKGKLPAPQAETTDTTDTVTTS